VFKAFVSSTYGDLLEHRMEVIRTIQAAGLQVDPMESWQADRATPVEFSASRVANCDLCILIVALRRGTIPAGQPRSIVQLEYDEARRRGVDVLPFFLREDVPLGPGGWPLVFDERGTDPAIDEWRAQLRRTHGVGDFGVDPKSLRIEGALARWVVQRIADRDRRRRRTGWAVSGALFSITAVLVGWMAYVYTTPAQRSAMHGRFLAFHDPVVYNSAKDGRYELARVLANRAALTGNTNLTQELKATQETLDMLVNNAQYIRTSQYETFRNLIRRGVHLRLVLWDYTAKGDSYEAFHRATGISIAESREGSREMRAYLLRLRQEIASNPAQFRGSLEFRWNPQPLMYTMWIRDWHEGGSDNELGHLGVHFYRGETFWPSFRTSSADGRELIDNMHDEFTIAWERSTTELQNPPSAQ